LFQKTDQEHTEENRILEQSYHRNGRFLSPQEAKEKRNGEHQTRSKPVMMLQKDLTSSIWIHGRARKKDIELQKIPLDREERIERASLFIWGGVDEKKGEKNAKGTKYTAS